MAFDAESGAATGATVGTAFAPGVGTLLGAAAGGLIGLGVDTWSSDRSREKDQEDYQQNQLQNFMYGQEAQRNAASNEVAGLLKAGLNPALAAGANPASMVSAPMQNKEAPKFNPGVAQLLSGLRLQEAQIENVEADTEKKVQETTNLATIDDQNSLTFAHAKDLDATLAKNMPILFKEMSQDMRYSEDMRKFFAQAAIDAEQEGSSIGGVQGLEKYLSMRIEQKEALVKEMASNFDWNYAVAKVEDPNLVKTLVRMPQDERHNLLALSGKYVQEVATLAQTAETEVEKRKEISARIIKINREAQKILHDDNAQMSKEGDTSGLLWSLGSFLANSAVGMAKSGAFPMPK